MSRYQTRTALYGHMVNVDKDRQILADKAIEAEAMPWEQIHQMDLATVRGHINRIGWTKDPVESISLRRLTKMRDYLYRKSLKEKAR